MEEIQKATDALVEDGLITPMEYGQLTLSTVGTYISMIPSGPLPRPKWFNVNVASQTVGQGLAKSTEELGKSGAFRGKTPAAIDGFMYQYAGRTYAGLGSCGSKCHQSLQDALTVLTKEGKTNKEGLEEFESTLKLIQERNTTNNYLTDISDDFAEAAWRISSKGCRATHSFAPDTLVLAAKGFLPISQLKINDQVLAYNEATQQNGYYPITAVHKHLDPSITTLKLQTPDGLFETITTTPEHPFYVTVKAGNGVRPRPVGHAELNERWVGAGHLQAGDKLKLADGREGSVVNVTTQAKTQEMFNLTVETAHTFYVGGHGWLIHNTKPPITDCGFLGQVRNSGSALSSRTPVDAKGDEALLLKAREKYHKAPYTVEQAAAIAAEQARERFLILTNLLNEGKISRKQFNNELNRMLGLNINHVKGKEVGSVSSPKNRNDHLGGQDKINNEAFEKSKGFPPGQCAEPQGCASLFREFTEPGEIFNPKDFITYAFKSVVRFSDDGAMIIDIFPRKRCRTCSSTLYYSSPTDDVEGITYKFIFE
ncbi:polymorphic toxin-type HINT domain-containing protein [Deinococcus lacus]|uniref:Polymorphic toxin-type HINT domain-containing protein n=1 Tax=Deinococcus lacus TaxID=392561 RepID=A0ABW1YFK0_9DEIO